MCDWDIRRFFHFGHNFLKGRDKLHFHAPFGALANDSYLGKIASRNQQRFKHAWQILTPPLLIFKSDANNWKSIHK